MGDGHDLELYVSHDGNWKWVEQKGGFHRQKYVNATTEHVCGLEKDRFGYFDLEEIIKKLGYASWDQILYRYVNDKYWTLKPISEDKDIMQMFEGMGEAKAVNIYVDGGNKLDSVEKNVEVVCGTSMEGSNVEVGGPSNVNVDEDVMMENAGEGADRLRGDTEPVPEFSSEDDLNYDPSGSPTLSEVSLDDLDDFICDEEYHEVRKNMARVRNIFDLIDAHDGFDVDHVEVDLFDYSQSDGDLDESESENDCFNPSKGRVYYDPNCDHKTLKIQLGMYFQNGLECRKALTSWAIENGKFIRFKDVTPKKLVAHCEKPCPWYVYGCYVKSVQSFMIKTVIGDHTCPRSMYNKLCSSNWIAHRYLNLFRIRYNLSMRDLRDDILSRYKTNVHKDRLYRARAKAQELVRGSVERHYASIRSYLGELRRVDREGRFELLLEEDSVFKGLFIGFSALRKAFKASCRPLIGLDGCHLKTYLGGILLTATSKDGNNHMCPIAWAVVEIENEACWTWFLKCLFEDLQINDGLGWTFISDQQKGLENAVALLAPHAEHRNCARHVYMNWKKQHKGVALQNLFWRAVNCTYEENFKLAVQDLKSESNAAYEDFMARDIRRFCKAFISTTPCSDAVDNNVSETWNSWIVNARNKHVIRMCEEIRRSLMVRQVEKFKEMSKVTDFICPKIREILEKSRMKSVDCIPFPALQSRFEIQVHGDMFVVDVPNHTCSCRVWDLTGIPCVHAISAIQYLCEDPAKYVNDYYSIKRYLSAYEFGIQPIRGQKMWVQVDGTIVKPPLVRRMAGRPKKKKT